MSEEDAIDPEEIQRLEFEVRGRQRLLLGAVAGAIAAAVGAAVWAGIVYYAQMEIAWIAIGIGFLVGFAVRTAGRGVTPKFGILGALLSLLSVVCGKYFAIIAFVAQEMDQGIVETMGLFGPAELLEIFKETFSFFDLLFYGIAVYMGYNLGFRDLREATAELLMERKVSGTAEEP